MVTRSDAEVYKFLFFFLDQHYTILNSRFYPTFWWISFSNIILKPLWNVNGITTRNTCIFFNNRQNNSRSFLLIYSGFFFMLSSSSFYFLIKKNCTIIFVASFIGSRKNYNFLKIIMSCLKSSKHYCKWLSQIDQTYKV